MSTTLSTEGFPPRKKRILIRSWHRGTKEMDLILGGFTDKHLHGWNDADLDAFEFISDMHDVSLFNWISGVDEVPQKVNTPMFKEILKFVGKS